MNSFHFKSLGRSGVEQTPRTLIMTIRLSRKLLLLLAGLALFTSPIFAKNGGQGNSHKHKGQDWKAQDDQAEDDDRDERGNSRIVLSQA